MEWAQVRQSRPDCWVPSDVKTVRHALACLQLNQHKNPCQPQQLRKHRTSLTASAVLYRVSVHHTANGAVAQAPAVQTTQFTISLPDLFVASMRQLRNRKNGSMADPAAQAKSDFRGVNGPSSDIPDKPHTPQNATPSFSSRGPPTRKYPGTPQYAPHDNLFESASLLTIFTSNRPEADFYPFWPAGVDKLPRSEKLLMFLMTITLIAPMKLLCAAFFLLLGDLFAFFATKNANPDEPLSSWRLSFVYCMRACVRCACFFFGCVWIRRQVPNAMRRGQECYVRTTLAPWTGACCSHTPVVASR